MAAVVALQRLAAGLACRHASALRPQAPQLAFLTSLRGWSSLHHPAAASAGLGSTPAATRLAARQQDRRPAGTRPLPSHTRLQPAASYSVVTGGPPGDSPGSGSGAPLQLIVYSKEGCHLCEGLKEKLEALIDRAQFMPCALSGAQLEVRDIATRPEWEAAYGLQIPVLALATGSGEVEVPRPAPRLSADALQRHIEKFVAAQQQQQE